MRKTMNICNVVFTVLKDMKEDEFTRCLGTPWGHYNNIYTAYKRPSKVKIGIWESWYAWLWEVNQLHKDTKEAKMWISSRNGFMFTLSGIIEFENGERYGFHITKTRQEIFKLV